jgi:hypothetical protein
MPNIFKPVSYSSEERRKAHKKLFVLDAHGCVFAITSATKMNAYEIYARITLILLISKTLT